MNLNNQQGHFHVYQIKSGKLSMLMGYFILFSSLRTKASLVYDLAQRNLTDNLQPNLQNLRQHLVSLEVQINSAITAIDRLAVRGDAHLDSDATTAQSLPSEYDECAHLDYELEKTLREMKR